jgi:serine protease Do
VSSPPVVPLRVCANGPGRVRSFRARRVPVGFLVRAASIFLLLPATAVVAQFPIRQMPGARGQGSGVRGQESEVRSRGSELRGQAAGTSQLPLPAVARIVVPEKDGISYGSGTLVDARGQFGLVVSNWHVVRDAAGQITVEFPDGFKSPAEVVKTDKDWDLAALSIYRPHAAPMPVTATAPQPGEALTIGGYGSGQWRMAAGACTQYLAPGVEFPHEMVELSAEARQGDSGGPILNQRGELAGVLFGSGPGYTSGSYGGRVLKFLAAVVPGGAPGNDGMPSSSAGSGQGLAALNPGYSPIAPPPQATALHEQQPSPAAPFIPPYSQPPTAIPDATALTPALKPTTDPLLSPPPRREVAERFAPRAIGSAADDVDPRVAVVPSHHDLAPSALLPANPLPGDHAPATALAPLAPRIGVPPSGVDVNQAPPEQLLAGLWKHIGGPTLFDQTKAVLAGIGILSLVVVFLRFGSHKEREHEEE